MRTKRDAVIYSQEFRKVVQRAYPDNQEIQDLLNNNQYFLGRYLDDGSLGNRVCVSADEVITAVGLGKTEEFMQELFKRAGREKLRSLAYEMWDKEWFTD